MLQQEIIDLLQYRIQQEEYSGRLYEQMSLWLNNNGYINSSVVWKKYSDEEFDHSQWAKTFLLAFGILPIIDKLDSPKNVFTDLKEIIDLSYDHEVDITNQVKELASKSLELGDFQTFELSLKYNKEQVEELEKLQTLKDVLNSFGDDKHSQFLLDININTYA